MHMENTTTSAALALELDTHIAELWNARYTKRERLNSVEGTILRMAGARYYYRGRQRVTDMTLDEALVIVERDVAAYTTAVEAMGPDNYRGAVQAYNAAAHTVAVYEVDSVVRTLTKRTDLIDELAAIEESIDQLEEQYTGWNRYYLVTSSAGHIHRSTCCSTCRPTTTYGWLPELSGKSDADAVAKLGPALCSVCFPDAPVEHQGGKITKGQAEKLAA